MNRPKKPGKRERRARELVGVAEAGRVLGVSAATVWRLLRAARLPSVRSGGRRLIPVSALRRTGGRPRVRPFTVDNPMFKMIGAAHGDGRKPGSSDKHALLDG